MSSRSFSLFIKTALMRSRNSFVLLCVASFFSAGVLSSDSWGPKDATLTNVVLAMALITIVWMIGYVLSETISDFSLKLINPKYRNFVAIVPVCVIVTLLTLQIIRWMLGDTYNWPVFVRSYFFILTLWVFCHSVQLYGFYWARQNPTQVTSPFFKRLSARGPVDLIAIEAQDHYLQVKTNRSNEMVRASMSDAVAELKQYDGLRVHRSHWVALDAVEKFVSTSNVSHLLLKNGKKVPVSRSYRAKVRELSDELGW